MNSTKVLPPIFESPSFITVYEWEKNVDLYGLNEWMSTYWIGSIYISALYVAFIFAAQYYMQHRKPFRLNNLLTVWNLGLAIFSVLVFTRTLPEFIAVTSTPNGIHNSMCQWTEAHNYATVFWSNLFLWSKLIELGDTVFIVLRKQKLIFLHWYHHMMTLITSSLLAVDYEPHQLWYIVMNSFIHSLMYSYYALKAGGVKVPRSWAMAITTMQLVQMVLGVMVNVYAWNVMWLQGREADCARGYFGLKLTFCVAMSYLLLFSHFFYTSYVKSGISSKVPHIKGTSTQKSQDDTSAKKIN